MLIIKNGNDQCETTTIHQRCHITLTFDKEISTFLNSSFLIIIVTITISPRHTIYIRFPFSFEAIYSEASLYIISFFSVWCAAGWQSIFSRLSYNNNYNNISHSDTLQKKEWEREKNYIIFSEQFFSSSFLFLPFVLDWIGVKHFFFVFVSDFFLIDFRVVGRWEGVGWKKQCLNFFTQLPSHPAIKSSCDDDDPLTTNTFKLLPHSQKKYLPADVGFFL